MPPLPTSSRLVPVRLLAAETRPVTPAEPLPHVAAPLLLSQNGLLTT